MKVYIGYREVYPIYEVCKAHNNTSNIEVDIETLKRWKKVFDDFRKVQIEIAKCDQSYSDEYTMFDGFSADLE